MFFADKESRLAFGRRLLHDAQLSTQPEQMIAVELKLLTYVRAVAVLKMVELGADRAQRSLHLQHRADVVIATRHRSGVARQKFAQSPVRVSQNVKSGWFV
jgi:hypothetical protein